MSCVLITGATSGFGPTIAFEYARRGASLILHGRDRERLDRVSASIRKDYSCNVNCVCLDALMDKSGEQLFRAASSIDNDPDIVIHHIGGTNGVRSTLCEQAEWLEVLRLNVLFAAEFNSSYIPYMVKNAKRVRIIHISSISALSLRGSGPYAAAKAFLNAYITTTAREVAMSDVTVCGIMPGAFCTPGSNWERYKIERPDIVEDFLRHHHASGRLGEPSEILSAISFLADHENTFSQGCIVNIDGGTM